MKTGYYTVATLLLLIALGSCKPKLKYDMKINLTRLTNDNIYDEKLVGDAIFDARELKVDSLKNRSSKLFLQGVDLYKNKKKPDSAVAVFKQSLLVFPQVDTYYEIADALMAMQADAKGNDKKAILREALEAYNVAAYLHYKPASFLYYNMACAENLLGDDDSARGVEKISMHLNRAASDLRNAFMNGFNDTAMMQADTRINSIMKTDAYKQMIAELNAQKKPDSKPETVFDLYKDLYPTIQQPFAITLDKIEMTEYKTDISFEFAKFIPEMENTSFGRDVSHDYYVVGKLAETPLYTAVIFTSTELTGDGGYDIEPVYTKLVTYTPEGNIIDSRLISCRCTEDKAKTVKIENNIITSEEYKTVWKYSSQEMDSIINLDGSTYPQNKVVRSELLGKEVYKLTDIGKIVEAGDSVKVAYR